jgi:hypothetical protein
VRVAGVNDSPTVVDDSATLNVTGSTTIRPLDNDFDVDGTINPLSLQLTLQPAFGSVVVQNDGSLIYTPFEGSRGADFIRYTVADDLGARSAEATITIDTNQAPIALNDNAGTLRQQSVDINVVANDSDPDGSLDLGSIVIVKSPARGTATPIGGGLVRYEPASDFVGVDSFEYTIRDNQGRTSNVALVRVQVVASQLQNPNRFPDVNASGEVSPLDALLIINRLSRSIREGTGTSIPVADLLDETPRYYYDVDGSQLVQPLDALLVINAIAAQNRLRTVGEGESIMAAPPIVAASFTDTPPAVTLTESQPVTILPDEKVAAFDWVDDDIEGIAADVVETRTGNRQEASDLELIDAVWGDFR